jgi:hypothetical protein
MERRRAPTVQCALLFAPRLLSLPSSSPMTLSFQYELQEGAKGRQDGSLDGWEQGREERDGSWREAEQVWVQVEQLWIDGC